MNEIETKFIKSLKAVIEKEDIINAETGTGKPYFNHGNSTPESLRGDVKIKTIYGYYDFQISIESQFKIGQYIADFTVCFYSPYINEEYVAIEIDGHQWHEKTKEQVMRDKKRERYFLRRDFQVMRFSGTEVFYNSDECAKECLSIMIDRVIAKLLQDESIFLKAYSINELEEYN